jgi:hypothetical protein
MNGCLQTNRSRQSSYRLHHVQWVALPAWLMLALPMFLGCGQDAPSATVEGTLRMNGKPLDNCLITFLPEPGQEMTGPHSTGLTDQRGYYRLRFDDQREGATVGWHRVTVHDLSVSTGVRRRDHGTVDEKMDETAPPPPVRRSRVPPRYSSPKDTPLRKEAKPGRQVIDLDIR